MLQRIQIFTLVNIYYLEECGIVELLMNYNYLGITFGGMGNCPLILYNNYVSSSNFQGCNYGILKARSSIGELFI